MPAAPTEPTAKAPAVRPHRLPRARSPSGLMLASIDSPQGDQDERRPATTARTAPRATIMGGSGSQARGAGWDGQGGCRRRGGRRRRAVRHRARRSPRCCPTSDPSWTQLCATPSPSTRPSVPSTSTAYGDPGTEKWAQAALDSTTVTSAGARPDSNDGLSSATSRAATITRVPGRAVRCAPSRNPSHHAAHVPQPEDRNSTSVRSPGRSKAMLTASPAGVRPTSVASGGAGEVPLARGAGLSTSSPAPNWCRRRRISAWLRSSPATSTPSSPMATASTTTSSSNQPNSRAGGNGNWAR